MELDYPTSPISFRRSLGAALVLVGLGFVSAAARLEAQQDEALPMTFHEVVQVQWVVVPVVVESSSGYVADLESRDFRLYVDGEPTAIETFEKRQDAPVSLVLLQDLSGSMALSSRLELSRLALDQLLGGFGSEDEISLVTFSHAQVRVEVPFTTSHALLAAAADRWSAAGKTGLYDAVSWLPEVLLEGRRLRRGAVILTDGRDNASSMTAESSGDKIRRTQLPVYVIELGTRSEGQSGEGDARPLVALAERTGGRHFQVTDRAATAAAVLGVAEDLRHQYVLAFATADAGERPAHHSLAVEVRGKRRRARFRRNYFGHQPATTQPEARSRSGATAAPVSQGGIP